MSRSRSRKFYDDYDDDRYFEQFKNRRRDKQKRSYDRESFDNDVEDEKNDTIYIPNRLV